MSQGLAPYFNHTPSRAVLYGVDRQQASLLITYASFAALVGRLIVSFVAPLGCVNRVLLHATMIVLAGVLFALNTLAVTYVTIVVVCTSIGFLNGEYEILFSWEFS